MKACQFVKKLMNIIEKLTHRPAFYLTMAGVAALVMLCLSAANVWFGPLNQDEGWYLMAAGLVRGGAMPYRDFAFTQGPVMPLLYAPLMPLVDRGGLLAARIITVTLSWLTALIVVLIARRLVAPADRRAAMCLTLILVGVNVYQNYFTTIVKTYALASLLLSAGFFMLFIYRERPSRLALMGAAAAFVMAAGTRLSLAVVGPIMGLGLIWMRRPWPRAWVWFGVGGVLTAGLMFLPFALAAPEGMWFGMMEYHAGRSPGNMMTAITLKAGFISRVTQAYFVAASMGVLMLGHRLCFQPAPGGDDTPPGGVPPALQRMAAGALALVTLIHLASPFPYDDYQTVIFAPACALLIAALVRYLRRWMADPDACLRWATLSLLTVATAAALSSPINQDWFVSGRDRIWWRFKEQSDLATLRDAAHVVRELMDATGEQILTQDAYLAAEIPASVPTAMALGPFSYFPDMPTDRAQRLHVLNRERMIETLRESAAAVAAFSGYGLSIAAPDITPVQQEDQDLFREIILERYEPYAAIEDFGQAHTTLRILRKLPETENAP